MDLTARDVQEKQFHDAWRGYNQEEVDDFLDRVAEALDRVGRENASLRQRITELDQAVSASRNTEEMLKKTLVTAQRAAEEAIATAKAKAEQLITEAEQRSRRAAQDAERRNAEVERDHANKRRDLDNSLERLKAFEAELKLRLSTFLDQQQRALQQLDSRPTLRSAPATQGQQPERVDTPAQGTPQQTGAPQEAAAAGERPQARPWRPGQ